MIPIGLTASLDTRTRRLRRNQDGKSVTLPASAALCLHALAEANGDVLSPEKLMDIGWRNVGFAATQNSVRVMISKLRSALVTLDLDQQVNLLAVTRSGYRLIVLDAAHAEASELPNGLLPSGFLAMHRKRALLITASGIAAGAIVGLMAKQLLLLTPKKVDFIEWQGQSTPVESRIWVPKGMQTQHALIEATLRTYTRYVLEAKPHQSAAKELYVTLSAASSLHHQGVIACQQTLQEVNNACQSYYFRVN